MDETEKQPLLWRRHNEANGQISNSTILEQHEESDRTNEARNCEEPCSMTLLQKISYGLGHIYNDLCASMWFSYSLLFLQAVLHMESTTAGSMMLLGQVVDALATPIVGILVDKHGSKRLWHLIGTALVLCSFPLIFSRCLGCWMNSVGDYILWWQPFYYAIVIICFQCGWAIVQITHLAMIPTLTNNLKVRSELTAIRYTASVISSVIVYLITWVMLKMGENKTIGPADDYKFRDTALFLTGIGCIFSITFHCGIQHDIRIAYDEETKRSFTSSQENQRNIKSSISEDSIKTFNKENGTDQIENISKDKSNISINTKTKDIKKNFLLSPLLYQAAVLYVAARLFSTLAQVYMPLFLDERLSSDESTETVASIASVPLVSYIASFFASLVSKNRNKYTSNKILYTFGSLVSIIACTWVAASLEPSSGAFQLYFVAALMGAGSSITLISSLCITADMIGPHSDQGAVIYSIVTFADKLITGLAVIIIENYKCLNHEECPQYYRNILAYVCGGSAVFGLLSIIMSYIITLKFAKHRFLEIIE